MASPFSGGSGRRAAQAEMGFLTDSQSLINKIIRDGESRSLKSLGAGYSQALGTNTREFDLYRPYADTGLKALGQYSDATGLNGQEGHDRAVANFRAGPGYDWQVDQATDAVARKASALGALGSGNTMAAITDRASSLADLEYDDYLDRLNGTVQLGYNATGQQAGVLSDRAGLQAQRGRDRTDVIQSATGLRANTQQNTGNRQVEALHGGMMAGQNAAANRWNFGMQGLKTLAGLAGSF